MEEDPAQCAWRSEQRESKNATIETPATILYIQAGAVIRLYVALFRVEDLKHFAEQIFEQEVVEMKQDIHTHAHTSPHRHLSRAAA